MTNQYSGRSAVECLATALSMILLGAGPVRAGLVLNEIHPDPSGSDGGREFVEILNPGPDPISLEGVTLGFANGATGGPWEVRWTGTDAPVLGPGERFLLTDRNWMGDAEPDVEVWLGLQNGPDAVRLERLGVVLDLVGYGPLTDPQLMESEAADLEPGRSLARRPDGRDTGNNRIDFTPAEPTPGRPNFLPFAWEVDGWVLDPPSLDRPGLPVHFTVHLRNSGTEIQPLGPAVLTVGEVRTSALLDRTEPDQTRTLVFGFSPTSIGSFEVTLEPPSPPDGSQPVFRPTRFQVGPGSVFLNEVLATPADGQGEWIELHATGPLAVDLGGLSLGDADGDLRPLPDGRLEPGGFLVLAQDSLGLSLWLEENDEAGVPGNCPERGPIRPLTGWPILNNSAPGDRDFADRVILADSSGRVLDHMTLGGSGIQGADPADGRSLERMDPKPVNPGFSNWVPCGAPSTGTPGCPNSVRPVTWSGGGLTADPGILDPGRGAPLINFLFEIPPGRSGWRLRILDLGGALVRDLGGDALGSGSRHLVWDGLDDLGRPAGPGGYVAVLDLGGPGGFGGRSLVVVR